MSVRAPAIAAEDEFLPMPPEKVCREGGIARERIVAGVCRKIGEQIGVVREPAICNSAANDRLQAVSGSGVL